MLTQAQERLRARVSDRQQLCQEIKEVVVEQMGLAASPDWLTDDQLVIGGTTDVDSIDVIEVVVGLESRFGVRIADDQVTQLVTVNRIADFVEAQRSQA
jgi:acyl carrier protein